MVMYLFVTTKAVFYFMGVGNFARKKKGGGNLVPLHLMLGITFLSSAVACHLARPIKKMQPVTMGKKSQRNKVMLLQGEHDISVIS